MNIRDRALLFHEAIQRVLLKEWDPIGVDGVAEAQNEYDSYVPMIYKANASNEMVRANELFE